MFYYPLTLLRMEKNGKGDIVHGVDPIEVMRSTILNDVRLASDYQIRQMYELFGYVGEEPENYRESLEHKNREITEKIKEVLFNYVKKFGYTGNSNLPFKNYGGINYNNTDTGIGEGLGTRYGSPIFKNRSPRGITVKVIARMMPVKSSGKVIAASRIKEIELETELPIFDEDQDAFLYKCFKDADLPPSDDDIEEIIKMKEELLEYFSNYQQYGRPTKCEESDED